MKFRHRLPGIDGRRNERQYRHFFQQKGPFAVKMETPPGVREIRLSSIEVSFGRPIFKDLFDFDFIKLFSRVLIPICSVSKGLSSIAYFANYRLIQCEILMAYKVRKFRYIAKLRFNNVI